jgi:alkanesulfonate monooxygenase SsuD/methylene tetrahydromethanopterin reductase-like flavin-dependent oxidoreductase (luciferase family)
VHLLRTAERGLFDFLFLAEGLRLREHRGRIYDLDVVGRPDTFTVLDALAGITNRLGLNGTINTTFNEPFEVARQFAGIDHLSDGRAGWNMVTSSDAFTGANFRRGSFSTTPTATAAPRSSSLWRANSGTAGHPTWWPTSTPESMPTPVASAPSNITGPSSTCAE